MRPATVALLGVVMVLYWRHCARPALYYVGARKPVFKVVKAVGVVSWTLFAFWGVRGLEPTWPRSASLLATARWSLHVRESIPVVDVASVDELMSAVVAPPSMLT